MRRTNKCGMNPNMVIFHYLINHISILFILLVIVVAISGCGKSKDNVDVSVVILKVNNNEYASPVADQYEDFVQNLATNGIRVSFVTNASDESIETGPDQLALICKAINTNPQYVIIDGITQSMAVFESALANPDITFVYIGGPSFEISNLIGICDEVLLKGYMTGYSKATELREETDGISHNISNRIDRFSLGYLYGEIAACFANQMLIRIDHSDESTESLEVLCPKEIYLEYNSVFSANKLLQELSIAILDGTIENIRGKNYEMCEHSTSEYCNLDECIDVSKSYFCLVPMHSMLDHVKK